MTIYALANNETDVTVDVLDVIGKGFLVRGVTADQVVAALGATRGKPVNVRINSSGGSVPEANAIRAVLRQHGRPVNVSVIGLAASAATIIADAGTDVAISQGAYFMVHDAAATTGGRGTVDDHEKALHVLRKVNDDLVAMYAAGAARRGKNKTAQDFRDVMRRETYFTASEAVAWGLADRVVDDVRVAACADISTLGYPPGPLVAAHRALLAEPLPQNHGLARRPLNDDERRVCELLGLSESDFAARRDETGPAPATTHRFGPTPEEVRAAWTLTADEKVIAEKLGIPEDKYLAQKRSAG